MDGTGSFIDQLRWWRKRRGLSQLALAHLADISQRHLSFLEVGRAQPSREMVLRLAAALELPLRQQNTLLLSAGFAPVWGEASYGTPALRQVQRALDHMMRQQEPFPALIVDRRWNVLRENEGSQRLTAFLNDTRKRPADPDNPVNLADVLLAPDILRPLMTNWPEVARDFVRFVHADAQADGLPETAALLQRLLRYPDVPKPFDIARIEESHEPVLTMEFVKNGQTLRLFTTIATLGTPQDVTAQEIRIECFFPGDEATEGLFRDWAAQDGPR